MSGNKNGTAIFCLYGIVCLILIPLHSSPQPAESGEIHGDLQVDAQYYNTDSAIGAAAAPEDVLMNSFFNLLYTKGNFSAGARYEAYLNSLQGYDTRYSGKSGVPYRFINYNGEELSVTAGNFYEQFGSGLVLRSYEDKGLGLDNSFDGISLRYQTHGIRFKGLIGKQRYYFTAGNGLVRGFDGEININDFFSSFMDSFAGLPAGITLGGSFVSKYQSTDQVSYQGYNLKVPKNVGAAAGRVNVAMNSFNLYGEYAYKINDPSDINRYIYKPGEALFVNATYAGKGFGIFLAGKRADNMSFKSDRAALGTDLNINYLPAITRQHTYSLLAYYPYGTQPNGEIGYQAEVNYKLRKESVLGGKYGSELSVNYSSFNGLDTTRYPAVDDTTKRLGYSSSYFGFGEKYFTDINLEFSRKISSKLKMILVYAYQEYNKDVIAGVAGYGTIYTHVGMVESIYKLGKGHSLRMELQELYTHQDKGSWVHGLAEWGAGEHFYVMVMDQYNYGNPDPDKRNHYYTAGVTYGKKTTRISLSYGRQRSGYYCAGGVCRYIPSSNGITLSVVSSF